MPKRNPEPERRRRVRRAAVLLVGLATALAASAISAAGFDLAQLTAQLARVKSGEATFTEKRRVEMLDRTLESSGRLVFRAPDVFIRETLKPRREKLEVHGNMLTMSLGERSRTVQLDSAPEAAVIVEAIRGTLTGNRESLERLFDSSVSGNAERWSLELVPRRPSKRSVLSLLSACSRPTV
jgi:outer membrane lipoprotein-sorting protein